MSLQAEYTDETLLTDIRHLRAIPIEEVETREYMQDEIGVGVDFDPFGVAICWHKIGSDFWIVGIFRWKRDSDGRIVAEMRHAFDEAWRLQTNTNDRAAEFRLSLPVRLLRSALKMAANLFQRLGCAITLVGLTGSNAAAMGLFVASPYVLVYTLCVLAKLLIDHGDISTSLPPIPTMRLVRENPYTNSRTTLTPARRNNRS